MMRRFTMTAVLLGLALSLPVLVNAQPVLELGPACWKLDPYPVDVIELSVTLMSPIGPQNMFRLSGRWGSVGYRMGCAGAMFSTATGYHLDITCGNGSTFFGGGQTPITLSANLEESPPFNGTYTFKGSQGFTDTLGTKPLTRHTCGLPLVSSQADSVEQYSAPGLAPQ